MFSSQVNYNKSNCFVRLLTVEIIQSNFSHALNRSQINTHLATHKIVIIFRSVSQTLNVFNFFSISVSRSRRTHDLCIFERSQTFNYTLLKYSSLLKRLLCFCFKNHSGLLEINVFLSPLLVIFSGL